LKQSISTGNLELIKLMRERLPDGELRDRVELREVAAEFHQKEVLTWLLRDATIFERELLFALERKLAGALETALENGYRPWWNCARDVARTWRAGAKMEFVSAPEGFSSEGGWWTSRSGATSALPGFALGDGGGPARPNRLHRVHSVFNGEWTKRMSRAHLGKKKVVKSVVFPPGVIAIGESALMHFEFLESVVFPARCAVLGKSAFEGCDSLKAVSIPVGCKTTGECSFASCISLVSATIPAGCTAISDGSFQFCNSLGSVTIADGSVIGPWAFRWSGLREVMIPDGCRIDQGAFCTCRALVKVSIGSGCTSIGRGAFETCSALTMVTIGPGCISIGPFAFDGCWRLASVMLPTTVRSIGMLGFGGCLSLATIAIPKDCRLISDSFRECKTHVTTF
jgi:hypothetical protein